MKPLDFAPTSSRMLPGLSSQPIIRLISIAPRGIAIPSDQQSKKSSQSCRNTGASACAMPKNLAGSIPLEPRPSAATSAARMVMNRDSVRMIGLRESVLPFSRLLSIQCAPTASIREIAEEIAAMSTSR